MFKKPKRYISGDGAPSYNAFIYELRAVNAKLDALLDRAQVAPLDLDEGRLTEDDRL